MYKEKVLFGDLGDVGFISYRVGDHFSSKVFLGAFVVDAGKQDSQPYTSIAIASKMLR